MPLRRDHRSLQRSIPWYRRLEARVVLGVSLIAGLSLMALSLVAGRVVRAHALARAAGDLTAAQAAFDHLIETRSQSAAARNRLVTALPVFRAHMTDARLSSDTPTMEAMSEAYRRDLEAAFCVVSDANGRWLASPGLPRTGSARAAVLPAIEDARAGRSHRRIVALDGSLFLVVSEPARFADEVLGTLLAGYRLDDAVAEELARTTRCDIALVAGNQLAGASLSGEPRRHLGELLAADAAVLQRTHDVSLRTLASVQFVGGVFPLARDTPQAAGRLILLEKWEPTRQFVADVQKQLLWTGALVFLGALGCSLLVSRRMARPLREIATVAEKIAAGDWQQRVPVHGSIEAVAMAEAFNGMTAKLKERDEQLRHSQKMEAVGTLAGGVAHDFNNLLMAIHGYAELLMQGLDKDDDQRRGDLAEILRATQSAASLTRQLLAFSRKQILAPRVLDLAELVSGLRKMLHRLLGEDIELSVRLDAAVGRVRADPGQLEQVITNLAINARDAMPLGGRIEIALRNSLLSEAVDYARLGLEPGVYVTIAVSDTGNGMDAETRPRIFEPFFTTKEPGKGTGLGLAMVYGIVTQSGGAIEVDTAPGKGTTFRIHLPAVDAVEEATTPAELPVSSAPGQETVLVVEDEAQVRTLICNTLRKQGYLVLDAANGNEALEVGKRHSGPIHLLLTDVVMPGMGGGLLWQVLSSLRPETKVMFMTGHTDDAVVRHGVDAAAASFLQKPFSLDTLCREVRRALDHVPAEG